MAEISLLSSLLKQIKANQGISKQNNKSKHYEEKWEGMLKEV